MNSETETGEWEWLCPLCGLLISLQVYINSPARDYGWRYSSTEMIQHMKRHEQGEI